jgi:sialic acid synthase SpsE
MNINYKKPFIIGEIGINHNGSVTLAKEIILLAKKSEKKRCG